MEKADLKGQAEEQTVHSWDEILKIPTLLKRGNGSGSPSPHL